MRIVTIIKSYLQVFIILTFLVVSCAVPRQSISAGDNSGNIETTEVVDEKSLEVLNLETQSTYPPPSQSSITGLYTVFLPIVITPRVFYVSTTGNDSNPGTYTKPWRTILHSTDSVKPGDTVIVLSGTYNEKVNISTSGITLQAQGKVVTQGVYISGNSNIFRGFIITDPSSSWGIRTSGNNNLIEGNEIYHTKQDGIWFFGSNNIFRGNYIHDILAPTITGDPHVDCFQTWGWDWDTTNVLFEKNICINDRLSGRNAIIMIERKTESEVRDITFRNNILVIYKPVYSSLNITSYKDIQIISNISIVNNTIVNLSGLGENGIAFINISNALAINNLLIGFGNKNKYIPYISVAGGTKIYIHDNAIFNTNGIPPFGNPYPGDIWMQDPRVLNLNGQDFHLQSNSPMIDTGSNLGNLVINDFDGVLRPQGTGYDIGAYEYKTP